MADSSFSSSDQALEDLNERLSQIPVPLICKYLRNQIRDRAGLVLFEKFNAVTDPRPEDDIVICIIEKGLD